MVKIHFTIYVLSNFIEYAIKSDRAFYQHRVRTKTKTGLGVQVPVHNYKGRTIRKVMGWGGGGWGKSQKNIHARENAKKKIRPKKNGKKKNSYRRKVQLGFLFNI